MICTRKTIDRVKSYRLLTLLRGDANCLYLSAAAVEDSNTSPCLVDMSVEPILIPGDARQ